MMADDTASPTGPTPYERLGGEPGVRSLVIQFRPEAWGEAFWSLPELRGIGRLLAEASCGFEIRGATRQELEPLFHVLEQQPQMHGQGQQRQQTRPTHA